MYGSKGKSKRYEPLLRSACLVVLKLGSEVKMRLFAYIFTKLVVIILVVKIGLFKVMRLQNFVVLHFQLYVFRAILLSQAQIPKFGYNRKVCIFAKRCRMRHKIQCHNCANASCVLRKAISYALAQKKTRKNDTSRFFLIQATLYLIPKIVRAIFQQQCQTQRIALKDYLSWTNLRATVA